MNDYSIISYIFLDICYTHCSESISHKSLPVNIVWNYSAIVNVSITVKPFDKSDLMSFINHPCTEFYARHNSHPSIHKACYRAILLRLHVACFLFAPFLVTIIDSCSVQYWNAPNTAAGVVVIDAAVLLYSLSKHQLSGILFAWQNFEYYHWDRLFRLPYLISFSNNPIRYCDAYNF